MESNYWLLWLDPGVKLYEQDWPSLLSLCAYCLLQAIVNLKTLRKLYLNCDFKMLPINSLCSLFWFLLLWNLLDPDAIKLLPLFRARELKIMLFKYPPSVSPCLSPSWWSPPPHPRVSTHICMSFSFWHFGTDFLLSQGSDTLRHRFLYHFFLSWWLSE